MTDHDLEPDVDRWRPARMPGEWASNPDRGCATPPPGWSRADWVNLWFPERGASLAAVRAVCQACPVRQECADHALAAGEHHGIWGGQSERSRRRMRPHTATNTPPPTSEAAEVLSLYRDRTLTVTDIANTVGISERTAHRHIAAHTTPNRKTT